MTSHTGDDDNEVCAKHADDFWPRRNDSHRRARCKDLAQRRHPSPPLPCSLLCAEQQATTPAQMSADVMSATHGEMRSPFLGSSSATAAPALPTLSPPARPHPSPPASPSLKSSAMRLLSPSPSPHLCAPSEPPLLAPILPLLSRSLNEALSPPPQHSDAAPESPSRASPSITTASTQSTTTAIMLSPSLPPSPSSVSPLSRSTSGGRIPKMAVKPLYRLVSPRPQGHAPAAPEASHRSRPHSERHCGGVDDRRGYERVPCDSSSSGCSTRAAAIGGAVDPAHVLRALPPLCPAPRECAASPTLASAASAP